MATTSFPATPNSVAGPTNPQVEIARLMRQLQMQRTASPQQTGLQPSAQPWQGYAGGGSVHPKVHDTGDPHLDGMLDEVHSAMSGTHPDPEAAAMNYADLLMPGSMHGYQPQGMAGGGAQGDGQPDISSLLLGGQDGGQDPGAQGPGDGGDGSDQGDGQDVGLVQGPGGGMDDQIGAQSDDGQQIQLSNGEFVIPADVVAMLGDGSTEAGSQKLYQLIDQIRQSKYGQAEQPEPTGDDVFDDLTGPPQGAPASGGDSDGASAMSPEPPQGSLPPEQQEQPGAPSGLRRGGRLR